jgi:hypothetical protein
MYPPAKPNIDFETPLWDNREDNDEEGEAHQVLSIDQYLAIREKTEDDEINDFIASSSPSTNSHVLDRVMHPETHDSLASTSTSPLEHESSTEEDQGSTTKTIEIIPGRTLNINRGLTEQQREHLVKVLQNHNNAFTWDYSDMKGIHPDLCTHHIYIKEGSRPIFQPQHWMNPTLRDIVKEELQKLLATNFIYPISDKPMGLPSRHCTKEEW